MDAAQPDVLQGVQLGIEGTKGVGVQANLYLPSLTVRPKPIEPITMLRARGSKVNTNQVAPKGAHTQAALTGYAAFLDLVILQYQVYGIATSTAVAAGVVDLTWLLKARKKDDIRTATWEVGGEDYASRFDYGSLIGLGTNFTKQNNDIDGALIGRSLAEQGVIMTATPTEIPNVPMSPDRNNFYVAETLAGLTDEANNLLEYNSGKLTVGERRSAWFSGSGSSQRSYQALVEKPNTASMHMEMLQGSKSDKMMAALRKKAFRFARIFNAGPEIVTGFNYEYDARFPFAIENPDRGAMDDVYGGMYDLNLVPDATLGGFLKVRIRVPSSVSTYLAAGTALPSGQNPSELIAAANTAAAGIGVSQGTSGQYT